MRVNHVHIPVCTSLMDSMRNLSAPPHDTVVVLTTDFQTAGRGQGCHVWESAQEQNLLVGILWPQPPFAPARQQDLSLRVANAVCSTLQPLLAPYGLQAWVKPPNDVWVGESKIAGILIEHDIRGGAILATRIGIGLNVNQDQFPASLPNPCSLRTLTGCAYSRDDILQNLLGQFLGPIDT